MSGEPKDDWQKAKQLLRRQIRLSIGLMITSLSFYVFAAIFSRFSYVPTVAFFRVLVAESVPWLQLVSFLVAIVLLAYILYLVVDRNRTEQRILRVHAEKHTGREKTADTRTPELVASFWDAFPFASLVFFLVSMFMLMDIASKVDEVAPEKLLLSLSFYLIAALVTSIVVLFGANLIKFEENVRLITDAAQVSAAQIGDGAEIISLAESRINAQVDSAIQVAAALAARGTSLALPY